MLGTTWRAPYRGDRMEMEGEEKTEKQLENYDDDWLFNLRDNVGRKGRAHPIIRIKASRTVWFEM